MSKMPKEIEQLVLRSKFHLPENSELGHLVELTSDEEFEIAAVSLGQDQLIPGIMFKKGGETFTFIFSNQGAVLSLHTALAGLSIQGAMRLVGLCNAMHDKVGCEEFHPVIQGVNEATHAAMADIMDATTRSVPSNDRKGH